MATKNELRKMVFDFALEQARLCVDTVNGSPLEFGTVEEELDVVGKKWSITVKFWKKLGEVHIEGRPDVRPDDDDEVGPLGLPTSLFAQVTPEMREAAEDSFQFHLPAAWLPR